MREYEIRPEPEADVAAALVEALERLAVEEGWDEPPGGRSAWVEAAAREAVGDR